MGFYEKSFVTLYDRLKKMIGYFLAGDELISIDIAVLIRTLVHDTKNQVSLLTRVNQKDVPFFDSANPDWEKPGTSFRIFEGVSNIIYSQMAPLPSGLVGAIHHSKVPSGIDARFIPISARWDSPVVEKSFDEWENQRVAFIDGPKQYFTRKDLVLGVCDQDGGAHYDEKTGKPFRERRAIMEVNEMRISKRDARRAVASAFLEFLFLYECINGNE